MHWLAARIGTTSDVDRQNLYTNYVRFSGILRGAGFPPAVVKYAVAQVLHESADGTSNVARTDNNYSGIKWVNKPYQKATKGLKAPDGGYYARFKDANAWAADYRRVLSLKGPKGRPIDARNANDFLARLKANNYFTSPVYATGYNRNFNRMADAILWANKAGKPNPDATVSIKYTGGPGSPNKKLEMITPATHSVKYVEGKSPKQAEADLAEYHESDEYKQLHKKGWPWWGYGLAGLAGLIVVKKLLD